ncbi:carbohydrate binding domain-containing protein [Chitinispirillales bacterium ANBcel5]|uniref:hypothetical protein n=1 Tax=Cellulosispirillum alkaliphilum TaxID=3039283 RepID=UPI002A511C80|nr:carbohydrate binding domain-containing protein [Chitinispirillales bacterium ANBcel5]
MHRLPVILIICAAFVSSVFSEEQVVDSVGNVLSDFSFEEGGTNWNFFGSEIGDVARSGNAGLTVINEVRNWSGADQLIALPEGAANITVSGWIKTEDVVQGRENWENARISIEYRDAEGNLVGGYPAAVAQVTGTTDWTHYTRSYRVMPAARVLQVQCALGNATGAAYFDDITVTIRDSEGNLLEQGALTGVMDKGDWYALDINNTASGSHFVDWSGLLHTPAGKHGFLTVKDGKFYFEDGTPARFWGTNLVAADVFASDEEIDSLVSRLSKMGANLLRLHHMDAPWSVPNIFGNVEGTRELCPGSMRQLDYLIHRCKEEGIYIFLDLLVHREFTEADGVEHTPPDLGGKQIGFFSEKIIELQKEFNEQLLNHVNEFTEVAYKDEPAIVASALINESTIFGAFSGDILTPPYRQELQDLWAESEFGDKTLATFDLDWQNDRPRLRLEFADADIEESIQFLSSVEKGYFRTLSDHLRDLGVKYPLAGSNMPLPLLAMLRNNAVLDFMASNDYWDHPEVWKINDDWDNILFAPFHNRSQFRNPNASAIQNKSYYRVKDLPFVITEWNHCYPNEYVLEGVPLMAAYSALQGWDAVLQFDFNLHTLGRDRIRNYTLSVQPEDVAQWVMAAPLFLRGDVQTAPGMIVEGITQEQLDDIPNYSNMLEFNYHLPFITRVAKSFDGQSEGDIDDYAQFFSRDSGIIRSETGELLLNSQTGYLKIDAPRVQGVSGFISDINFDFPLFSSEIENKHASIFAVSADGEDLTESKHFYLVVTGPAKMSGQVYDPTRNLLKDPGEGEVLVQVIEGNVTFNEVADGRVTVYPLALDGSRGRRMRLRRSRGTAGVLRLNRGRTLVYEVVIN